MTFTPSSTSPWDQHPREGDASWDGGFQLEVDRLAFHKVENSSHRGRR